MSLKFYNTPAGRVEPFVSLQANKVSLYTCGPTVYNYAHIGNWAAYIYWDILVRVLMANNYSVTRVMNITDVGHLTSDADDGEDKMQQGAKREGKNAWEIAAFYTNDFINGIKRLGLIPPQYIIKATDFIPEQINLIRKLKEKGFTYQIDDGIYFDTARFPEYANFAGINVDAQKAGARVEFNPQKRNHSDFALWKFIPEGEKKDMEWETPTDILDIIPADNKVIMGSPGWHLECSAIAMSILGNTIDIHTGGIDHIQIHHTNEIAQSEAATGVRFSNYWLHNNHLKSNGTKISKSLGNGYTLNDLEKKGFSPMDYRMFVLQGNYRNEGNFTFDNLQAAKNRRNNWRNIASLRHQIHDTLQSDTEKGQDEKAVSLYAASHAILEAINDDLNTPGAFQIIDETFSRIINASLSNIHRQAFVQLLETIDALLGLQLIESTPDISDDAKKMILERKQARSQSDWAKSDALRNKLGEMGILIRDTETDSVWEYKNLN